MKIWISLTVLLLHLACAGQNFTYPDSLAVIKNKVRTARIYAKSSDGKDYLQRIIHYDTQGRKSAERESEKSVIYAYEYDEKGRIITTRLKTAEGAFISKTVTVFHDQTGTHSVFVYSESSDSLQVNYRYEYDNRNNRILTENFYKGKTSSVFRATYDEKNNVISSYDSVGSNRTATYRENGLIVMRKTYDPQGKLLHEYHFSYSDMKRLIYIKDISADLPVTEYYIYKRMDKDSILQNNRPMSESEIASLKRQFWDVFPRGEQVQDNNGLPVPELINEHRLEYDNKGNITKDFLTQKMGSSREEYEFYYLYEYY